MRFLHLFLLLPFLVQLSCATSETNISAYNLSAEDYFSRIEPYSKSAKKYDGLQNTMDISATLLNTPVLEAQLNRQATALAWNELQYNEQKTKKFENVNSETKVFISFFTPERKNDDLSRNQTLWKVFLDTDGRRFEGKVERLPGLGAEIALIFPEHTKFATPYLVKFPVALATVESYSSKLVITGPLGNTELEFPAR